MHGVGKIERCGISRQGEDLATWREQIDLIRKQVDLDALDELERGRCAVLFVDQARHPLARTVLRAVGGIGIGLVGPVRGDAAIGDRIHVFGADLDLDRRSKRAEQHGVQRLVTVGFRNRDEIAETPVHRLEQRMHGPQRLVAVGDRIHDDPEPIHIHELGEGFLFVAHLSIDAVGRLDATDRAMRKPFGVEPGIECRFDPAHRFTTIAERQADTRGNNPMAIRIHGFEAKILQLGLEPVHAEALRDRRIDFERFKRNAAPRFGLHRPQRAHVVQAIGQLDQDHAQIARHRQQHLAEAFCRGFLATLELQLVEFGDAINQFADRGAELGGQLFRTDRRILERIVEDRSDDRLDVEAQIGEDSGDSHRMGDVGLAAFAGLPLVGLGAELISAAHARDLLGRQITGQLVFKRKHIGGHLALPCILRINDCLHHHLAVASVQTAA